MSETAPRASQIFNQRNGDVTKAYYADLNEHGPWGELGCALFRAQKRSEAAKSYKKPKFRSSTYDVKNWSLSEVARILQRYNTGFVWGWGYDSKAVGFPHVLYVELPTGQVSFHSPTRLAGPDFPSGWDREGMSRDRILAFCDHVMLAEPLVRIPGVKKPAHSSSSQLPLTDQKIVVVGSVPPGVRI